MEFWARWAHRALWHASLWHMHESHHRPREGPFELNDVFAIINAVPAISLLAYGFFHRGLVPGLCFGAVSHGLGVSRCVCLVSLLVGWTHLTQLVGTVASATNSSDCDLTLQVSSSHRASGLRCSAWPTCSSTTAWSTAASRSDPSPTCPTSAEWLPLTRYAPHDGDEASYRPLAHHLLLVLLNLLETSVASMYCTVLATGQ